MDHTKNYIRLHFTKWTFETLGKWMEEFCADSVAALQDLMAKDSRSNKLSSGEFLLLFLLVNVSSCGSTIRNLY